MTKVDVTPVSKQPQQLPVNNLLQSTRSQIQIELICSPFVADYRRHSHQHLIIGQKDLFRLPRKDKRAVRAKTRGLSFAIHIKVCTTQLCIWWKIFSLQDIPYCNLYICKKKDSSIHAFYELKYHVTNCYYYVYIRKATAKCLNFLQLGKKALMQNI